MRPVNAPAQGLPAGIRPRLRTIPVDETPHRAQNPAARGAMGRPPTP